MRDEDLRAIERAALTGDPAPRLKLADLRARTASVSVLDDFVCKKCHRAEFVGADGQPVRHW